MPDEELLTLEQARDYAEYGGVLEKDTVLVDIDEMPQAEILLQIVRDLELKCRVLKTDRGLHFLFSNRVQPVRLPKCQAHVRFAVGLSGDVKVGLTNAYEKLKSHGEERPCIYGEDLTDTDQLDPAPEWLRIVGTEKDTKDFRELHNGDGRNQTLYSYAFRLQKRGFSRDAVRETCRLIGTYVFADPLEDGELDLILRDEALKIKPEFSDEEDTAGGDGDGSYSWKLKFHRVAQNGRPLDVIDARIARYILEHNRIIVIDGAPYYYQDGAFRLDPKGHHIRTLIEACMFEELATDQRLARVLRLIISKEELQYSAETMELNCHPKSWINCRNGMLDLMTLKLHPHSPEYFSLNQIPFSYDPERRLQAGSIAEEYLEAFIPDQEDREMFLEYAGYCLTASTGFQQYMILQGSGGIGKSVLLKMISWIVGEDNLCAIKLQDLAGRFSTRFLFGKLLDCVGDLDSTPLSETGNLKMVTGEDSIQAEIKGGDVFHFKPYAKLLFSANRIPVSKDEQTDAFYRRILILHLEPCEKRFPDLESRLQADTETFFHLAVRAAQRAFKRGCLMNSKNSVSEVLDLYLRSDSVKAFLHFKTVRDPKARIPTTDLFDAYEAFCVEQERRSLSRIHFRANLREKGVGVVTIHGTEHFTGLRLAPPDYEPPAASWEDLKS